MGPYIEVIWAHQYRSVKHQFKCKYDDMGPYRSVSNTNLNVFQTPI